MGDIMYEAPSDPTIVKITVTLECAKRSEPPVILRDPSRLDGGLPRSAT